MSEKPNGGVPLFTLGIAVGLTIGYVGDLALGLRPWQVENQVAQAHCERQGYQIGRYVNEQIVCYREDANAK